MTALSLSGLPLAAGGAVASSAGRAGLWTLTRFMRAPLSNSALLAMLTLTAMAGSNALYHQAGRHPAPLFAPASIQTASAQPAVVPVVRPKITQPLVAPAPAPAVLAPMVTSTETTGSVAPVQIPAGPVGNQDVYAVQKRLAELGLFNGTVDGYYGPNTAKAIRAFEDRNGFKPMGAMSPAIVDAITHADDRGMAQHQAVAAPVVIAAPVTAALVEPVVAPQPVAAPQPDRLVARLVEPTPQDPIGDALNTVAESAAGTIDSIVASVDGGRKLPDAPAMAPMPQVPVGSVAQPASQPVLLPPIQVAATEPTAPTARPAPAQNVDYGLTAKVQRGLASLGFLQGPIDGHAGDATARAIREFEVYYNYKVTGQITPQLVDMLVAAGATV